MYSSLYTYFCIYMYILNTSVKYPLLISHNQLIFSAFARPFRPSISPRLSHRRPIVPFSSLGRMNELILAKTRCVSVYPFSQGIFGLRFNIKTVYFKYGVCIIKIRRSWDRIIFIIGIHILLRRHRYIKTPGLDIYQRCYHLLKVIRFWCMIWYRIRLHFDGIAKLYYSCLEIRRYETGCLGLALSKYFTCWKMPTSPYNYTRTFQQAVRK